MNLSQETFFLWFDTENAAVNFYRRTLVSCSYLFKENDPWSKFLK